MSLINAQAIIESINRIQSNSLLHQTYAWVAVTGKPELFVRDHLGADLSAHNPDVIVSREWNKHDLVILDHNAKYSENEDGCAINVSWLCENHIDMPRLN